MFAFILFGTENLEFSNKYIFPRVYVRANSAASSAGLGPRADVDESKNPSAEIKASSAIPLFVPSEPEGRVGVPNKTIGSKVKTTIKPGPRDSVPIDHFNSGSSGGHVRHIILLGVTVQVLRTGK